MGLVVMGPCVFCLCHEVVRAGGRWVPGYEDRCAAWSPPALDPPEQLNEAASTDLAPQGQAQ